MMRMKVGVSRKEATDHDGSVGATCEIEVEIPGNATDEEVRRIRDRWLGMCEDTVDEELGRLRHGASRSGPGIAAGIRCPAEGRAVASTARPEYGTPRPRPAAAGPTTTTATSRKEPSPDRRPAAPRLGGQAGPRRQGTGDLVRQEEGLSLEDRRLGRRAGAERPTDIARGQQGR